MLIKKKILYGITVVFLIGGFCNFSIAEVTPEIQLGGRGIVSLNVNNASNDNSETVGDFSDTSLLLGFRQKLYSNFRGQFVLGFELPDRDSSLDSPFFHHIFFKVDNRSNILMIGRTRLKSMLIEFPTLRDDDAIHFTDVLNPFIVGNDSEENQYGEILDAAHIFGQRYWINLYGGHVKEDTNVTGDTEEDFSFNTFGLSFQYHVPETQRWNRQILDQIGVGFNIFSTNRTNYSGFDERLKNFLFSAILNVYPDPVHFWDVRHQTIYNPGFSEIDSIADYSSMAKAESISFFTSVRYLYRKLERPAFQAALSYGYKNFLELLNRTDQHQFVANGFYRIGSNFDIGLQFEYLKNNGDLENLFGSHETRIRFALVYSIDLSFNKQFAERESLLNLEHGYIP